LKGKGRKRKDNFEWLGDRVNVLKGYQKLAEELYRINPVAYEVGPQAVSKLSLLAYFTKIYTDIIKSQFPKAYYADFFAGSGLSKIDSGGDVVLGSALIAVNSPRAGRKFDRYILFEKNKPFVDALRARIPSAEVFPGDVNEADIERILGEDSKWKIPTLGFVDPEGSRAIRWRTLEQLLNRWSDVIINYQVAAVRRSTGRSNEEGYARGLTAFFGTDEWQNIEDSDEARLELYLKQIRTYKENAIDIKVRGRGGYFYYMIVAVKETRKGSPWLRAIYDAKERIEKTSPDNIERLLTIYRGEQATL
jgi:three-Cys-motif partner protein